GGGGGAPGGGGEARAAGGAFSGGPDSSRARRARLPNSRSARSDPLARATPPRAPRTPRSAARATPGRVLLRARAPEPHRPQVVGSLREAHPGGAQRLAVGGALLDRVGRGRRRERETARRAERRV